jgi:hypothetical protein
MSTVDQLKQQLEAINRELDEMQASTFQKLEKIAASFGCVLVKNAKEPPKP